MIQGNRRRSVRFLPRKSTFVALRPEFVRLGKIVDISSSGLRFQYLISEDNQVEKGKVALDMFIGSDGYYLPDIPCETVYERKLEQHGSDAMSLEQRQCGIKFRPLNREQADKLKVFLRQHTSGGGAG
ncbi:MAG: PilZ domain-containing protein [Desulfobacterales bacterium]|nr:PilZ domain-containing protein [Desulfobacterales bacterium]